MPLSFLNGAAQPPEQLCYQLSIRFTVAQKAFLDELVTCMNKLRDPSTPPKSVSDVVRYMVDDAFDKCLAPTTGERLNG